IVGLNGEANKVKLRALLTPKKSRKRGIVELKALAREALANLPATRVFVSDPPTIEGLGDFFPVMVRLTGPDLEVLEQQGKYVAGVLRSIPGTVDIKFDTNPPKPELAISVDRTRAADLGLSSAQIATQLRLAIDGEVAAKLQAQIKAHPLPPGYSVIYDGQMKTFGEQQDAFAGAFALAFVFIFMVLASQFESLKHPFTIMVSLPLALVGARLALLVTGKNQS